MDRVKKLSKWEMETTIIKNKPIPTKENIIILVDKVNELTEVINQLIEKRETEI